MKKVIILLSFGFILFNCISCSEKDVEEEELEFIMELSDEYNLIENDIEFYDSSTCILFLKEAIDLNYRIGNIPDITFKDFNVKLNNELIFSGVFFPIDVAAPSPTTNFIGCYDNDSINSDIIQFEYINWPEIAEDKRRDERLIQFFNQRGKLRKGLSCSIKNVKTSSTNDSILHVEMVVKNNDNYSYFIPDPAKMSSDQFITLTRGIYIKRANTEWYEGQLKDSYVLDKNIMTLNNLSIIRKNEELTFIVTAKYDFAFEKGDYNCVINYGNTTYLNFINLPLNQNNGRVWIGNINEKQDFEIN